jgi:glyoxylase-like metal-dependent hydrolase (beta-lactamase superfamily II)
MTGTGNWTYFLPGRHPVLIDAGVGVPAHLEAIRETAAGGPAHVIVTHAHGDHITGVTQLAAEWPATRFSKWPWPERDSAFPVAWEDLGDGDVIHAGDDELHVLHTPGHAPDHVALWEPSTRTLFSGDLVVAGSTVVIPASLHGSLADYLRTLERLLQLAPARLLPAHGPPIDEPEAIIRHYIDHRQQREAQIVDGLRQGDQTVEALVARIYVGLDPALLPMARESVAAHLRKLEADGRAHPEGERWALY